MSGKAGDKTEPRVLICCDCGEEFIFTAGAQEYFAEHKFAGDPKRCKTCFLQYKHRQRGQDDVPRPNAL